MTSRNDPTPETLRREVRRTLTGGLGLGLALSGFLNVATLVVPLYDMQLYDRVLQSRSLDTLAVLSVACVVGLMLYGLLEYLRGACLVAIGEAVGRHLNAAVLTEGVRRAAATSGDRAGPELVRDLNELQGFLSSGAVAVPMDALCAPLFLLVLFMLHPAFGFLGLGGIAVLVLAGLAAEHLVRPALVAAQAQRRDADGSLSRSLSNPEVAGGLGMLPAVARRWALRHGNALAGLDRANARAQAVAGVSRLLRLALQAGVMALGAVLVLSGASTPGSLMGANLLTNKLLGPFDHLVGTWRHWALAYAAWCRIDALLASASLAGPAAGTAEPTEAEEAPSGLVVRNAALRAQDGRLLLNGIDLHVPPGTLVAVTGPNGAGKTTLLRLLAGLCPPSEGAVLLDGAPLHGRAGGVGYLPQSVSLLDGSVAENIGHFQDSPAVAERSAGDRAAEPSMLEPVVAAARLAEVHDLVGRMPRGYDTTLSGNGATLSGGMRQRIGLARALFGTPPLLVLDEPDASLDGEGIQSLLRALRACCDRGAIVVVTSHRPALRDAADRVVSLSAGTLADEVTAAPAPPPDRDALPPPLRRPLAVA